MKQVLFSALVVFLLCGEGGAVSFDTSRAGMPGPASTRFIAADVDGDGFLGHEEFRKAFPGLKTEAFGIIDTDSDRRISFKEWVSFSTKHGGSGGNVRLPHMHAPHSDGSGSKSAEENPGVYRGQVTEQAPPAGTEPLRLPRAR